MNKEERKNVCEIISLNEKEETFEFKSYFEGEEFLVIDHVPDDDPIIVPRLYQVCLGMGYLELPQVEHAKLTPQLLNTKNVYILDCYTDLFVWIGKKSTRLVSEFN